MFNDFNNQLLMFNKQFVVFEKLFYCSFYMQKRSSWLISAVITLLHHTSHVILTVTKQNVYNILAEPDRTVDIVTCTRQLNVGRFLQKLHSFVSYKNSS